MTDVKGIMRTYGLEISICRYSWAEKVMLGKDPGGWMCRVGRREGALERSVDGNSGNQAQAAVRAPSGWRWKGAWAVRQG